jgi:hypothetical protein
MCTVLLPPGGNPTAVNKYIIYICGKRPLVRPRCKFEDNIKRDFNDFGWEGQG